MRRDNVNDFVAFIAVAREQSFTKAAAKLGVSQSALSYTIRTLEARLGVRLLTRTTRSVSVTEAGEAILWPAVAKLMHEYPDVNVEIIEDYQLTDIVAERYDAGVRLGEQVAKDMISVRIGPDFRMAIVAAPPYFEDRPKPLKPHDLTEHACINLRLPTSGGFYVWEFRKNNREIRVRVQGRLVCNAVALIRNGALEALGLAHLPEDLVEADIRQGRLVRVLADWCPIRPGYHLYYPSRRQPSPAFALVVDALRHRA